jgi:CheY-like chemotaxis protein
MDNPTLRGRSILVVKGAPVVVMEIATALEGAGANVTTTTSVRHAVLLAEHDGLSAVIIGQPLSEDDETQLHGVLDTRGIPYVSHGGQSVEKMMKALEGVLRGPSRTS